MQNEFGLPSCDDPQLVAAHIRELKPTSTALAAFDADGTLWRGDVADGFTEWMIDRQQISGELWDEYLKIYADDSVAGCIFLLRLYRGKTRQQVIDNAARYWRETRREWIPEVVAAVQHLHRQGYEIWICSGTPSDFLGPLRDALPIAQIVAMDFACDAEGKILGTPAGIPCAGAGKAKKLLQQIGQRELALGVGNGDLDTAMMAMAAHAWGVFPNRQFASECAKRGWPVLPRPADFVEEAKFAAREP
ncbi:MAG: haloacid dehalogenase-like hydrolase [Deltaproteobacteria bacterium]|nr:haloacid dehalogenase-like hydrolase [Deltaproteobacteria bacterium]